MSWKALEGQIRRLKGYIMQFIYNSNRQVKDEFKKAAIDRGVSLTEVARRCDLIPQQLNNQFANKRLALSDLKLWCDAMDCDLVLEIRPRGKENRETEPGDPD